MNTIDGYSIEYIRVLDEYNQAGEKLIFIPPVNYERVR
jgi:hypothetical protein